MKTIIVDGKSLELSAIKGTVLSTEKHLETKISGGGGGGGSYNGTGGSGTLPITSKTTFHDQLFLMDNAGKEHSFQLQDFNLACREGNTLAVIFANKTGKSKGYYIAVINHTTDKMFFNENNLKIVGGPNALKLGGILIVLAILGCLIFGVDFIPFIFLALFGLLGYAVIILKRNIKQLRSEITFTDF